ncbi:Redox-sensing transcriptional repressor rex [Syntrophaceticus schinkii]|jgi:redox-sensing transcriptional repressor|uniref:Redox-sensing transcriptional repressor Rex n=2 Tax=Syntrophaceticus schinkii TaxID=499207 RepID=A0A0B7MNP9_9FIRM|nr:Redox-sensing transcriptional repressor rex [Syntrophaceticus schinkii]
MNKLNQREVQNLGFLLNFPFHWTGMQRRTSKRVWETRYVVKKMRIPEATVMRLAVYSRLLENLQKRDIVTTSSGDIAEGAGVSPAQVRKDLAYFGEFGTRGVGYNVEELCGHVRRILGLNQKWPSVLVGAGKLGSALALYEGFNIRGFHIVGVFDVDPNPIGNRFGSIKVLPMEHLERVIKKENVRIGIITVPAVAAQEVGERLVKAGVKAILNFSPHVINLPADIIVRNVDFSLHLEVLAFNLTFELTECEDVGV